MITNYEKYSTLQKEIELLVICAFEAKISKDIIELALISVVERLTEIVPSEINLSPEALKMAQDGLDRAMNDKRRVF